jgi:hypothetical protein
MRECHLNVRDRVAESNHLVNGMWERAALSRLHQVYLTQQSPQRRFAKLTSATRCAADRIRSRRWRKGEMKDGAVDRIS